MNQTEDWQSDKSEVSLLESIPTTYILAHLDEAITWLEHSAIAANWKYALQTRLLFRKVRTPRLILATAFDNNRPSSKC